MALGFGFNKTKVLSAAEKYVQQGKLPNAISEYEKVVKEDPKDLTVLNTIGDLYARIGQADKATDYFKRVGDTYASQGFTVKAIAMYKKLTKLNVAATDCVLKLAELYTLQGLYNDARAQYVIVAEHHMKANELEAAAKIFQRMLELDPENTAMQTKLADLYIRLNRKEQARDIFFKAAESLFARSAFDAADEALSKVLSIEPNNTHALLMRGQIAVFAGKPQDAIERLEKVPDIDSQPDGLRALLKARLALGQNSEAEPIARKLLNVHNDLTGVSMYAEGLMAAGSFEAALRVYDQYSDRFLAADHATMVQTLQSCISRVKESAPALELLRDLFLKAGESGSNAEVAELLAHAYVQAGELAKARDLYNQLSLSEPENPLHAQNYKQIVARLGEDSAARPLSEAEGAQAFMVDELEPSAPVISQEYPKEVADAISAALTESELFDSYNLPAKAIPLLESALAKASADARLNQRLASLYARADRLADAARCCSVLHDLYSRSGHATEAAQYAEMAAKYTERAGAAPAPAVMESPAAVEMSAVPVETAAEFSIDVTAPGEFNVTAPVEAAGFTVEPPPAEPQPVASAEGSAREIDLSDEWESMLVTEDAPAAAAAPAPAKPATAEIIEEIQFYLGQSMWEEARAAIAKCEAIAPGLPALAVYREQLEAATAAPAPAAAPEPVAEVAPAMVEGVVVEEGAQVSEFVFDEAQMAAPPVPAVVEPEVAPEPLLETAPVVEEMPVASEPLVSETIPVVEPVVEEAEMPVAIEEPAPAAPVMAEPEIAQPVAAAPAQDADILGDFTSDLEKSLGEDFALGGRSAKPLVMPPPAPMPAPAMAAQAAAQLEAPVAPPIPAGIATSAGGAAAAPAPATDSGIHKEAEVLSDMFAEFKEDVEEDTKQAEDPDTHYNLGVAFKEMGLLDEAIGELQKVCTAIDHGYPFSQTMQAYTWLAHCFVEKGVPQAGIKWYEKALKVPQIDTESALAVHYELGSAYEAAGDRKSALNHFLEVYGTNIDYRDVAERIKGLKS